MLSLLHSSGPPLAHLVSTIWLYEGYCQPHAKERLLPNGEMTLVVNLNEDCVRTYDRHDHDRCSTHRGAVVIGAHSEYFVIDTAEQSAVLGVQFKPGGAFPFFHLPAGELQNRHISLEDIWGCEARELREQLLEARLPADKIRVMERALCRKARGCFELHPAVGYALRELECGELAVAEIVDRVGMSAKRFIDLFRDQVGLSPKMFSRIRRFQTAMRTAGTGGRVEWADIALGCGYFDQSHFIRDFRAFSGINPSEYLARRTEHLNHVPLPGA